MDDRLMWIGIIEEDHNENAICNCGHEYCNGYKYMQVDPFAYEINEDRTLYLMCDAEAYESAQDI